jgi:hypothetical protein
MLLSLALAVCLIPNAQGAEVVWLSPPDDALSAHVAEVAGAQGLPLGALELRSAATHWSDIDQQDYSALDAVLRDVRAYETKFDGELVIMRDLAGPIADISLVRDDIARGKLYAALAYQGFAVNRYFNDALASDEQAAPYRAQINGVAIELPWYDAVAIDPERSVTPYDIAEAPQRVNYGRVNEIVRGALPASLTPVNLPEGSELIVDGRPTRIGPAGNVKLPPGRHLVHVQKDEFVLARWDLRLEPGEVTEAAVMLTDEIWMAFLSGLTDGGEVPPALHPSIQALGGEVWIARPGAELTVYSATSDGLTVVDVPAPVDPDVPEAREFSIGVAGTTGWFYDGNFYLDNPASGHSVATVNAGAVGLLAEGVMDVGALRVGAGLHTQLTLGSSHVSRYGKDGSQTRLRPYAHLLAGIPFLQATVGYQFPHHAAAGGNLILPIGDPLEIRSFGTFLIPISKARPSGERYQPWNAGTAGIALGLRI